MKLALIYNRNQRVRMGERCSKVLSEYNDLDISQFDLKEVQELKGGFDLYFRIDDGDYNVPIPESLHPYGWWLSDTHLKKPFKKIVKNATGCDYIFCCQKEGAEKLSFATGKQALWIAPAADGILPSQKLKEDKRKKWDICFIGTTGKYSMRKVVLETIKINYPNSFIGRVDYSKIYDYYSKSRIVVNYPINNDINMRMFEAMGAGALVVTSRIRNNGFNAIFKENEHLVVFDDIFEDMMKKINFYLNNTKAREKIAQCGFEYVRNNHTYRHRLILMINTMGFELK